jgi:hypothetical protein
MLAEKRFKFVQLHPVHIYPRRYIFNSFRLGSAARNRHAGSRHPNVT